MLRALNNRMNKSAMYINLRVETKARRQRRLRKNVDKTSRMQVEINPLREPQRLYKIRFNYINQCHELETE